MNKVNEFNAEEIVPNLIKWIKDWFDVNGKNCNAIIGISGGKDSTVSAALCVKALGADRVIGVSIPDEGQDNVDATNICKHLGIKCLTFPISDMSYDFRENSPVVPSAQAKLNLPARLRMCVLYYVGQSMNGRVVGTCNLSENYVGYFTKFGDGVSDCEPLANFTCSEVKQIGYYLDLPKFWVDKTPDDNLPGSMPDEKKFGFSYAELDDYIRNGVEGEHIDKIKEMHNKNMFKIDKVIIPTFPYK